MIKPYFKITLSDYNLIEKEGYTSHLIVWWNIFPAKWFEKRIIKLRETLINKLNDNSDVDEKVDNAVWQFESLNKINAIKANYLGLLHVLKYQPELNSLKQFYQKYTKKRLRIKNSNQFGYYAKGIKDITGIDIKTVSDIKKVSKLLEFRIDKYNENFRPKEGKQGKQDKVYLMGFALGVFSKLNMSFNPNQITVIDFIDAKNKALEMNRAAKPEK